MGKIKIRSYNSNDKCFYYFLNGGYFNSKGEVEDRWKFDWENAEQFTGLHDKDDKEIHEGDIFKISPHHKIYTVEFCDGAFEMIEHNKFAGHVCFTDKGSCEIIGNIHENPELLK